MDQFKAIVDRAEAVVATDQRFLGLAIVGSKIRGEMDEFSDLDLLIVCKAATFPTTAGQRELAASIGPLASAFTGEHVGEKNLLICLYEVETTVHVDLKFEVLADLERRANDPVVVWERDAALSRVLDRTEATPLAPDYQWIEDRFWTWVHYAGLRLGRAELFDLIGFLGFIRERVLGPMALHMAGFPPHGVRKIERYLPDFARELTDTLATYDVASCYVAIHRAVEIYRQLRATAPVDVEVNERAERLAMAYLDDVASTTHGLKVHVSR